MQYLVQQPGSLYELSLKTLADWILSHGKRVDKLDPSLKEHYLSLHINTIRIWLDRRLSFTFYDQLAITLLQLIRLHSYSEITTRMIQTVFTKNLTHLKIDLGITFNSINFEPHMLTGLTDLTFCPNDDKSTINLLKELNNLKNLQLWSKSMCDINVDNILECLTKNCKSIQSIKMSSLESLYYKDVKILTGLKHLKSIDLSSYHVNATDIIELLMSCENIEEIVTHENTLEEALEKISIQHPDKRFNLLTYRNSCTKTSRQLQLVVLMCPLIKKVTFRNYEYDKRLNLISAFQHLENLRELELARLNINQLVVLLKAIGHKLDHLELNEMLFFDLNYLKCVSLKCPNLQSLSLKNTLSKELDKIYPKIKLTQFVNLKTLFIELDMEGNSEPTDGLLYQLLSTCPHVEYLTTSNVSITDTLMLKVLNNNPMIYLKKWRLDYKMKTPSKVFLEEMVEHCINCPDIGSMNCHDMEEFKWITRQPKMYAGQKW